MKNDTIHYCIKVSQNENPLSERNICYKNNGVKRYKLICYIYTNFGNLSII